MAWLLKLGSRVQEKVIELLLSYGGPLEEFDEKAFSSIRDLEDFAKAELCVILEETPRWLVSLTAKERYESNKSKSAAREAKSFEATKEELLSWFPKVRIRKLNEELLAADRQVVLLCLAWMKCPRTHTSTSAGRRRC